VPFKGRRSWRLANAGLGDLELENMPTFSRRAPAPFVVEVADVTDAGVNA
jgi:hypothetical protein